MAAELARSILTLFQPKVPTMLQNVTVKEVHEGYAIMTDGARVVGDNSLEDKADIVLTIPIENLLILVSNRMHLPYAGLVEAGTAF